MTLEVHELTSTSILVVTPPSFLDHVILEVSSMDILITGESNNIPDIRFCRHYVLAFFFYPLVCAFASALLRHALTHTRLSLL